MDTNSEKARSRLKFKVTKRNNRHVHFTVFGANEDEEYGKCGDLCVCTPVFDKLSEVIERGNWGLNLDFVVE